MNDWQTPHDLGLPYDDWREGQDDLIRSLDKPGIHVLEAPTGTGKTAVAIGLAEIVRRRGGVALVVMGTHLLQDQYAAAMSSNPDVLVLKGKTEYACELHEPTTADMCEYALLNRPPNQCPMYGECGYYTARDKAKSGEYIVVMAYAFWMAIKHNDNWPRPDLVVFDEAHNSARHVSDHVEFNFSKRVFEAYGVRVPRSEDEVVDRVRDLYTEVRSRLKTYSWFEGGDIDQENLGKLNKLRRMTEKLSTFLREFDDSWIVEVSDKKVTASPVWARGLAEAYLYGGIPNVVFMSATIGDPTEFAWELGLPEGGYDYTERPSPFPVENREVSFVPWCYTSGDGGRAFVNNLDTFVDKFDACLDEFGGVESGLKVLVHTISYDRAELIYLRSKYRDNMIRAEKDDDKYPLVEKFKQTKGFAILIGPAFEEGIDLPDDECRVNILTKVPYPDLGDRKTKIRVAQRPQWIDHITSVRIVQACGRGVRSNTDFCATLIVDAQFKFFLSRARFPAWFKAAIRQRRI